MDRHVERGGRLVGDQEIGLVGERHGDHDALALPAGELMWKSAEAILRLRQAHQAQELDDACARRGPAHSLVEIKRLGDLLLDAVERVERGHGLLEDHGDAIAPDRLERSRRRMHEILALEQDAALGVVPRDRIRQQLQDRECRHRLSGAAFADERQCLALREVEGHAFHRVNAVTRRLERDGEIADRKERLNHQPTFFRGSNASRTASPMKTSRLNITPSVKKAVKPSHGAWRLFLP